MPISLYGVHATANKRYFYTKFIDTKHFNFNYMRVLKIQTFLQFQCRRLHVIGAVGSGCTSTAFRRHALSANYAIGTFVMVAMPRAT